jgi:hypothetical protein
VPDFYGALGEIRTPDLRIRRITAQQLNIIMYFTVLRILSWVLKLTKDYELPVGYFEIAYLNRYQRLLQLRANTLKPDNIQQSHSK